MCGIAGYVTSAEGAAQLRKRLPLMSDLLAHRGPDGAGSWVSDDGTAGLAHRRLAILDLSEAGAQPMVSADGRYVIVFNGEIYNHRELREALKAEAPLTAWRGHSDTETLLAAISRWGLVEALQRSFGMFALALWDNHELRLCLARDRMGEKPLYFGRSAQGWAFASELPALLAASHVSRNLNAPATAAMLATGAVHDEACIIEGIRKVRPGTILTLGPDGGAPVEEVFEDFRSLMQTGRAMAPGLRSETTTAAAERIEGVLREVISSQMVSDVPLGCFLSGGIDSSLVATLMQVGASTAVKTFCIGFRDMGYDESEHAEAVAHRLGTDHHTLLMREDDALELVPQLAGIYGEPFADSSQIPTLLLCRAARKHVTVALTGDGGDEVFGGYNRHVLAPRIWSALARLPRSLRRGVPFAGRLAQHLIDGRGERFAARFGLSAGVASKLARFGEIAGKSGSLDDIYRGLTRSCEDPHRLMRLQGGRTSCPDLPRVDGLAPAERIMALDSMGYLPSDILVKLDRASMSASLETRAPFLDARVVKAAWSLALEQKIRKGVGKAVLRDILYHYLPRGLFDRPKQGFAVPIDAWLRGPLRSWAAGLLSADRIEAGGVLDTVTVGQLWAAHLSGQRNEGQTLWSVLMLQQWLEAGFHNGPHEASEAVRGTDKAEPLY